MNSVELGLVQELNRSSLRARRLVSRVRTDCVNIGIRPRRPEEWLRGRSKQTSRSSQQLRKAERSKSATYISMCESEYSLPPPRPGGTLSRVERASSPAARLGNHRIGDVLL